jgi:hypothetical protein
MAWVEASIENQMEMVLHAWGLYRARGELNDERASRIQVTAFKTAASSDNNIHENSDARQFGFLARQHPATTTNPPMLPDRSDGRAAH